MVINPATGGYVREDSGATPWEPGLWPAGGGSEPAAAAPAGEVKVEEVQMEVNADGSKPAGGWEPGSEPAVAAPAEEVQKPDKDYVCVPAGSGGGSLPARLLHPGGHLLFLKTRISRADSTMARAKGVMKWAGSWRPKVRRTSTVQKAGIIRL